MKKLAILVVVAVVALVGLVSYNSEPKTNSENEPVLAQLKSQKGGEPLVLRRRAE